MGHHGQRAPTPPSLNLNGVLPVYKPRGMGSKDVSRQLLRMLGKVKMGHVGTLDPDAEGVLPILLGTATRVQDWLLDSPKLYACDIYLGESTDTLDREGKVTATAPWEHVTLEAAREVAKEFLGPIRQVPPAFSAIKHHGVPLYTYARGAETLSDEFLANFTRSVEIYRLSVEALEGRVIRFRVWCSKGTYVRSLVRDISEKLGTCGRVDRLVREAGSGFTIDQTLSLEGMNRESVEKFLIPIHKIEGMEKISIPDLQDTLALLQGMEVNWQFDFSENGDSTPTGSFLMLSEGEAFGIGKRVGHNRIRLQRSLR